MARLGPVAGALARLTARDFRRFNGILGNNFFLFLGLLSLGPGAAFVQVIFVMLLLLAVSGDPLRRMPADRVASWPLSAEQRRRLRAVSILFNPAMWMAVLAMVFTRRVALVPLALAVSTFVLRFPRDGVFRLAARIPAPFGELFHNNLRQMLSLLDVWVALLISISGSAWLWLAPGADCDAAPIVTMVVVVALSTMAQALFGLDGEGGLTRYRLLPLRGWRVLLAKHAAFFAILFPLVLLLTPVAGVAAGLVAVAVGSHTSIHWRAPQHAGTFSSGPIVAGIVQAALAISAGLAVARDSVWWLAPCVLAYCASLGWYGRRLERL